MIFDDCLSVLTSVLIVNAVGLVAFGVVLYKDYKKSLENLTKEN